MLKYLKQCHLSVFTDDTFSVYIAMKIPWEIVRSHWEKLMSWMLDCATKDSNYCNEAKRIISNRVEPILFL